MPSVPKTSHTYARYTVSVRYLSFEFQFLYLLNFFFWNIFLVMLHDDIWNKKLTLESYVFLD